MGLSSLFSAETSIISRSFAPSSMMMEHFGFCTSMKILLLTPSVLPSLSFESLHSYSTRSRNERKELKIDESNGHKLDI